MKPIRTASFLCATLSLLCVTASADPGGGPEGNEGRSLKVMQLPMRSAGPGSLDPIMGSTTYDNRATVPVYEQLLQYKYLKRPYELEPLLLAEMPTSEDGVTWNFVLKSGVRFQDDPCFEGGVGRELVTDDVFFSFRRFVDPAYELKSWWLLKGLVAGLDDYKDAQKARVDAGEAFDYSAPVEGLIKVDDHRFQIRLTDAVYSFMWRLPMFQFSIVPREAVEHYGSQFAEHPVGTGPFRLESWVRNKSLAYVRNPTFRGDTYPTEWMPEDEELGLHLPAGKPIPFVDRIEMTMFVNENPMWLDFLAGNLGYTQVPAENYLEAFHKRSRKLKKSFSERGVVAHAVPLLDFIFRAFNMEDPVLGGYTEKQVKLRKAISLAADLYEFDASFYNSTNIIYDGMIPPGLDGYPEDGKGPVSFLGPDLERAQELLAEAGYLNGEGLPVIDYYVSRSGNIPEQAELFKRQLAKIGVELNVRTLNFAQLIDTVNRKKAPLFSFSWSTDYPDGENNLALFYGPNESPGSNHFNYKNEEYDLLYEQILSMGPSPERTAVYQRMRDMVLSDVPFIGSMARTRFYVVNPWLKNYKPDETFYNWLKYMDVDDSARTN